tara:strand:+ start:54 stop:260 length:207 start_codon:yes stop_codon:yes gene_type:complete
MSKVKELSFDNSEIVIDKLLKDIRWNLITIDQAVEKALEDIDVQNHWEEEELITIFNQPKELYPITEH